MYAVRLRSTTAAMNNDCKDRLVTRSRWWISDSPFQNAGYDFHSPNDDTSGPGHGILDNFEHCRKYD